MGHLKKGMRKASWLAVRWPSGDIFYDKERTQGSLGLEVVVPIIFKVHL
jgi:hypothetical protein